MFLRKPYSDSKLKQVARYKGKMTRKPTKHEGLFLKVLRGCYGGKIIQQKIFISANAAYITDFFLPELKLVFEIDGHSHDNMQEYDKRRTGFIGSRDVKVVRFANAEAEENDIVAKIQRVLAQRKTEVEMWAKAHLTQAANDFLKSRGKINYLRS